ncbi:MAG TPA: type II toxin-antitoxin system VapC family toxin [Candidatus Sulfotelmatobacter sp.]|nr:type II toxin-antitoxin system VapC family toxin [Candidatus Sulfotelmatobacter sp.]
MIVVDANLLIYSYDSDSPHHAKSRAWVEQVFSDVEPVGLSWQTLSAFLRVVTNRRLPGSRLTIEQAAQIVEEWLAQPNVRIIVPGDDHWSVLKRVMVEGQASGPLVSDAELVALTVEYGAVLYTADRDFARFPGLRWVNPLS